MTSRISLCVCQTFSTRSKGVPCRERPFSFICLSDHTGIFLLCLAAALIAGYMLLYFIKGFPADHMLHPAGILCCCVRRNSQ